MLKVFFYFLVLATATLALQPAKRDDTNYEENKKWRSYCYKDCASLPVRGPQGKVGKYTCRQTCDRNFPIAPTYGCVNGYCWSTCIATNLAPEWCYTTRSYSQSYQYVRCRSDSECQKNWHCGGPCAAF